MPGGDSVKDAGRLHERDEALAAGAELLSGAREGAGGALVITGPAGIGKTSVLKVLSARAEAGGVRVARARGTEFEREFGFGVIRQLFEPLLSPIGARERRAAFTGAAAFAREILDPPPPSSRPSAAPGDTFAALHGLYWLCSNLAEPAPLLLVVDDAQWADRPSLSFLSYLVGRLGGMPAAALIARRRDEPGAGRGRALLDSLETGPADVISLAPLSEAGSALLVSERLGATAERAFCSACHEASGGNPLLLMELCRTLQADGIEPVAARAREIRKIRPARIARYTLGRLASAGAGPGAVAHAAALLGPRATVRQVAAVADLSPEQAGRAVDVLVEKGVLQSIAPLEFVHPVVREAIAADVPPAERARTHARAARILAHEGAPPEQVCAQLLEAEPAGEPWVVERLADAAEAALGLGAPAVAARYLRRALTEPPPPEARAPLLLRLGAAAAHAGDPDAGRRLREAFQSARDPLTRVAAAVELGQVLSYAGELSAAAREVAGVLAAVEERRELARPLQMMLLVMAETDVGARAIGRERLARARAAVQRDEQAAPRGLLAIVALEAALVDGDLDRAVRLAEWALSDGRLLSEQGPEAPHTYFASGALTIAGRFAAADRYLSDAMAAAGRRGSARGFAFASAMRALVRYRSGELDEAEADARACLELRAQSGWEIFQARALAVVLHVLLERGQPNAAKAELERWPEVAARAPGTILAKHLDEGTAELRLALGQPREALLELERCRHWEEAWGARAGLWTAWRSLSAQAHALLGQPETAAGLAAEELALARALGAPCQLGVALRAAALTQPSGRSAPREEQQRLLEESVHVLQGSEARLEHARSLVELGAFLRRGGRRSESRDPLQQGMDLAAACGATALAGRAREELKALGARPRRLPVTGAASLTASERRIAEMATEGLSNREIAQALFVTRKTVEKHLGAAYAKLGISTRDELSAKLKGGRAEPEQAPASA